MEVHRGFPIPFIPTTPVRGSRTQEGSMSYSVLSKLSRPSGKWLVHGALALLSAVSMLIAAPARAEGGWHGEIRTFARTPADPGFPEGIAVHGNRVYVSGPAT